MVMGDSELINHLMYRFSDQGKSVCRRSCEMAAKSVTPLITAQSRLFYGFGRDRLAYLNHYQEQYEPRKRGDLLGEWRQLGVW